MVDSREISDALALLAWQHAAGVDAAVGFDAIDWTSRGQQAPGHNFEWPGRTVAGSIAEPAPTAAAPTPKLPGQGEPARPRAQTPIAPSAAETEARRAAAAARTLDELEAALRRFDGCGLKATATKLCFYRGSPSARLMLIGEAPGREEDLEGKPFVGRAGQLLDKMLVAIGLTEADVHIANVVYWRPPGNRTPTPQETLACRPFLERQMELVAPKLVVALGGSAAKEMLGATEGIMRLRGKQRSIQIAGRDVLAIATLHPAYLLRTPAAKQLAWLDLLTVKTKLAELT